MILRPQTVEKFPEVNVFFASGKLEKLHLIASNGVDMLCCNEGGEISLIALVEAHKVSPINNDKYICRFDDATGAIIAKDQSGNIKSTGPIRGAPDHSINLRDVAGDLGLKWETVLAARRTASDFVDTKAGEEVAFKTAVTPAEEEEQNREPTYDDVKGDGFLNVDEIEVPEMDDLEISDEFLTGIMERTSRGEESESEGEAPPTNSEDP